MRSKDRTHVDVHEKIFYQSPGRKGKDCLLPGINVFTLVLISNTGDAEWALLPVTRPPTVLKEVLQIRRERSAISFSSYIATGA